MTKKYRSQQIRLRRGLKKMGSSMGGRGKVLLEKRRRIKNKLNGPKIDEKCNGKRGKRKKNKHFVVGGERIKVENLGAQGKAQKTEKG